MAAAIPHLVGFHPEESLVVISLRGPRKRIGLTMRFDLPPPDLHAGMADEVAARLAGDGAEHAVVACCTTEARDDTQPPRAELIELVRARLRGRDIMLMEALLVRDGRWWSYLCDDPECCPPCGAEVPPGTDIAAAHALVGRALLPDRKALADQLRPVEFVARRAMEQALERAGDDVAERVVTGDIEAVRAETVALVASLADRYADSVTAQLTDDEAARVVVGLVDVHARDQALVAGLAHDVDVAVRLFIDLCRRALPPDDAPTCTALAWLAYADGNGALANVALERAFASAPDYSLARLLRDALHGQVPPSMLRQAWLDASSPEPEKRVGRRGRH